MFIRNRYIALAITAGLLSSAVLLAWQMSANVPVHTVVIDPGHGGIARRATDDKWDEISGKYIQHYAMGMRYRTYNEHEVMLALSKRVKYYLDLTTTETGWYRFRRILRRFSGQKQFKRVRFRAVLTRKDGWNQRKLPPNNRRVNDPYRLYDFPSPRNKTKLLPGRLSFINSVQPSLVVSLHMNPAYGKNPGGMGAVLAPGYRTFKLIKDIGRKRAPMSRFMKTPWARHWMLWDRGWNRYQVAHADAWVYFNGYRAKKNGTPWLEKYRGYRYNMVTWKYKDAPGWAEIARKHGPGPYSIKHENFKATGPFWDREKGKAEHWRREGGLRGYGGDNHYASDELLRFVQYGARSYLPYRRKPGAMGAILPPFISTYSMPTFVNAVVAFLEIGHLNRKRDRTLVTRNRDREATARALAVGIYSLYAGMKLRKGRKYGPYRPRGRALNFKKYRNLPGGDYFKIVSGK